MAKVIYFEFNGRKHYISATSRRTDGRLLAEYTTDEQEAKVYETASLANKVIGQVVNHHHRIYSITEAKGPRKKRAVANFYDDDIEDRGGTGHGDTSYSDADPGL